MDQTRHKYPPIRERVFIYASLKEADDKKNPKYYRALGRTFAALPKGCIVGSVEIIGCKLDAKPELFAYGLKNPYRAKKPFACDKPASTKILGSTIWQR